MKKELTPKVIEIETKKEYQRLLIPGKDTVNLKSGCVTLDPGESVGEHSTENKEEAILILEGKAEVLCSGRKVVEAQEKSIIYIPPETRHNIKNVGQYPLKYVFIVVPI